MNRGTIDVIVPIYKVEKLLDRCVESLVGQTFRDFRIILVDDGSPDRCPAMCDTWAERDPRITVIHKENGGLSDARNAGLSVARGEYVCFVDSDDWVLPDFLWVLYNVITENRCDLAECGYQVTSGETKVLSEPRQAMVYSGHDAMKEHLCGRAFHHVVWNKLYRRTCITVPFEKGKLHEDVFWTYQVLAGCQSLAHIDTPLYCYFQRPDSIMGEAYSVKRMDAVEATARQSRFVSEHFPDLAGLAQGLLIGTCMYHHQKLRADRSVDADGSYRKWVHTQAKNAGKAWKKDQTSTQKQRLWMGLYLKSPEAVCALRNRLRIGL